MYRFLYLSIFLLLGTFSLNAQNQTFLGFIEAGDKATIKDDHYNAYRLYAIASEDDWAEDRGYEERISEVYYKTGLAAYRSTAYVPAEKYLLRLTARPDATAYPLAKFYLAQSTFRQGRYDQAVAFYDQFLDEQPEAPEEFRAKALAQINEADWAIDNMSREDDIQLRHLPAGINTEDSDVMYVRGPKGTRYFSSNDFEFDKDTLRPKRMLSKILRQTGENTAEPLGKTINIPGKNVAHAAFTKDFSRVYYSVCEFRSTNDEVRCDLYVADVSTEGKWSNPRALSINQPSFSTTQPTVAHLKSTGKDYLFFASDRPGGKGGLDIYRAMLSEDGTVGSPEAMETINTSGEDAAPFWYDQWQTLYFTTNGRFSFGGLDIYKSFWIADEFKAPINLGAPVNSSADDAYYTRFDDPDQAYVASRRINEESLVYSEERDVCCYDLYEFKPDPRITLQALTFNKLTAEELLGVTVKLCKITPSGPVLIEEITEPQTNVFNFQVEPGEKYQLKATKDGFTSVVDEFDLSDPEFVDVPFVERRLELAPKVDLDVFTFNNVDKKELPGTTVSLYEILASGERELVEEITNPTANDSHFELEIGKNYEVTGRKPGFGEKTEFVDLTNFDADNYEPTIRRDLYLGQTLDVLVFDAKTEEPLGNATVTLTGEDPRTNPDGNDFHYTVNLDQDLRVDVSRKGYFPSSVPLRFTREDVERYDGRLEARIYLISDNINDFLDLRVYFDNDHPDPDAYRTTTTLAYDDTYQPYIDRIPVFKELVAQGISQNEGFLETQKVVNFFDNQVIPGYEDLVKLAEALVVHMENGRSYEIKMLGYASPRAPTSYNLRLSARRNVSLENFFKRFQDGALLPFIKSKQLQFQPEQKGEETDMDPIYDLLDRERESIYSVEASLRRRVEFPQIFNNNSRK